MSVGASRAAPRGAVRLRDHTADVALEVRGATLEALFAAAARGLLALVLERPPRRGGADREPLALEAVTLEGLLVAWLDELLHLLQEEGRVPVGARPSLEEGPRGWRLRAEVATVPLDPPRHRPRAEVKATTHHGLAVRWRRGGWTATVVFDV